MKYGYPGGWTAQVLACSPRPYITAQTLYIAYAGLWSTIPPRSPKNDNYLHENRNRGKATTCNPYTLVVCGIRLVHLTGGLL